MGYIKLRRIIVLFSLLIFSIILLTHSSYAFGDNSFDNFTSTNLSSEWVSVDPLLFASWSLTAVSGHLQISIPAGKTYNCRNGISSCLRVMKSMQSGDTVYETKIDGQNISIRYQSYGIILYQDGQNYITYELWAQGKAIRPSLWKIINNKTSAVFGPVVSLSAANYLRITKTGALLSTYYSNDGTNWILIKVFSINSFSVANAGVTVNSYQNNPSTVANFDYYKIGNPPPVDTTSPTITITSQTNGQVLNSAGITISGTAADDVRVKYVQIKINSGVWANATGNTSWTYAATLALGPNNISAQSYDTSNNPSAIAMIGVTYVVSNQSNQTNQSIFPVRYSANSRYLIDQNGNPWPILGRTAWFVISVSAADYHTFIDDTASKGYNSVEMHVIDHDGRGNNPPFNGNNNLPFLRQLNGANWAGGLPGSNFNTLSPDFSTPNEAYWTFVDGFLNYSESKNITVFFFPAYVGYGASAQGWMNEMEANGQAKMQSYGAFLANRYKNQKNLVWMLGGDMGSFTTTQAAAEQGLYNGLISVSGQQSTQFSAEWNSEMTGTEMTTFGQYMTLNSVYSFSGDVNTVGRRAYSHSPVLPAFLLEEPYDQEGSDGTGANARATQPVRRFQWWGFLSTIAGYISGNGYVWPFNTGIWQAHLDTQGARDMAQLNTFIKSINWWNLVPTGLNGMKTLITAGGNTPSDATYVSAAATLDGTLLVAYIPPAHTGSITVDMTAMSANVRARWMDPTTGAYTLISGSPFANTGTHAFTPSGNNANGYSDWVLVLDTTPVNISALIGQNFTLTVTKSGTGSGSVTSNPSGINCGPANCSAKFVYSTIVTLTATPIGTNVTFSGWSGACSGVGTCTLNITQNMTANAQFDNQTNQPAGLILGYGLNEGVGTIVTDLSPSNIAGNINGATWTTSGKYSNALSFNGAGNNIDLGTASKLGLTGSMTWSAWVKNTAWPGDDGQIIAKSDGTSGWQLKNTPDTGPRTFGVAITSGGTSVQRYSSTQPSLNTWYYVAGVYNAPAQTLNIYVNGVLDNGNLVGTIPASQTPSSANAYVGQRNGGYYFDGIIDEVRVYNRTLTQAEIVADMNTPVGGSPIPQDSTPPIVAMTSPTNGATVVGTISLTATATDNDLMSNVQFVVDGTNYSNPDTSTPYSVSLDTTTVSNAAHTITAIATDRSGNTATATPVSITVNNPDTTPPTLSVGNIPLSPQPNQAVTFTATATDTNNIAILNLIVQGVLRNSNCTTIGNTRTCTYIASSGFANNTNVAYSANATDNSANHNFVSTSGNVIVKDLSYRPWVTTYYGTWSMQGQYDSSNLIFVWPNQINWTGIDFVIEFTNLNVDSTTSPFFMPAIPDTSDQPNIQKDYICDPAWIAIGYGGCPPGTGQKMLLDTVHSYGGKVLEEVMAVNPSELNKTLADSNKMNTFVDAIVSYGQQRGFDGVDINIEGNGVDQPPRQKITAFLTALRNRMNQNATSNFRYITLAPQVTDMDRYDPAVINSVVDQLNMQMGNSAWLWDGTIGHNVAYYLNTLNRGSSYPSQLDPQDWTMSGPLQWIALGYSASKLGIGTPSNAIIWHDVTQLYQPYSGFGVNCQRSEWEALLNNGGTEYWDDVAKVNYISGTALRTEGNTWYQACGITAGQKFLATYDSPQAYPYEVSWMLANHFGGIMIYDVGLDLKHSGVAFNQRLPNHKAVVQALGRG